MMFWRITDLHRFVEEFSPEITQWFCDSRNIPMTPAEYQKYLPTVYRHMDKHYTGTREYNAWYSWHTCHKLGILKNGMPVKECRSVNAEMERIKDMYSQGGIDAVNAYRESSSANIWRR